MQFGLGDNQAKICVYIANTPDYDSMSELYGIEPLQQNDIYKIGQACGNGWRKVFNVYAKYMFALSGASQDIELNKSFSWIKSISIQYDSWQSYRDNELLQTNSKVNLTFSPPVLSNANESLHIVMGRTYAKSLNTLNLEWFNNDFAISSYHNLIVCPYFDYRQLSNIKIIYLVEQSLKRFQLVNT